MTCFWSNFFKTWVQSPVFLSKILAAPLYFCSNERLPYFEVETQNRIIREPHFLLKLSQKKKKKSEKTMFIHFKKIAILFEYEVKLNKKS